MNTGEKIENYLLENYDNYAVLKCWSTGGVKARKELLSARTELGDYIPHLTRNIHIVALFVSLGFEINSPNYDGYIPLHYWGSSLFGAKPSELSLFILWGADVDCVVAGESPAARAAGPSRETLLSVSERRNDGSHHPF